ncbi:MFS transporter [Pseudonocardia endophytica]|uniref:Putative MFS family arabinose efflux permease n=1 Tax=Pseudonocardia endophytica TaxID=401976 RepID=A0A4V2PIJ8_PSEEN|nr:MFS transporter [Pseudonocardia endophytica]TCK24946.1 putative MFS family arabinose efflux permease [Pseudonocardia endophytica]
MGRVQQGTGSPRLTAVFRVAEFRALWFAEVLSVAGDQLARLALTVVVLQRTGSPAWSAVVYALTFLPALAGGLLLGPLADRFPRRTVMVVADLVRLGMVAVMAVPGVPLWVLATLVVLVVLAGAPHTAAQGALLPDVLDGDLLQRGIAVRQITGQVAQVAGFAVGGLVVAVLTPSAALLIDAATFGLSALVVGTLVRRGEPSRADAGPASGSPTAGAHGVRAGLRLVLRHPRRRYLVCIAWLVGIFVLPEALAASYAQAIGVGAVGTGILMSADPVGSVVGALLFARLVPVAWRDRALVPLAVGAAVPLLVAPLTATLPASFALWAVSGACATAALVQAQAGFVRATPADVRGTATGVAASGLVAAQGVAILLGGLVAERTSPPVALAACGAGGLLLACGVLLLARTRGATGTSAPPASGVPA